MVVLVHTQSVSANPNEQALWRDAEQHPNGWLYLPWLGWFTQQGDWIFHLEHGWQYYLGETTQSFHFHDTNIAEWGWSAGDVYPWIYWYPPIDSWAWYERDSGIGDRMFLLPGSETVHERDLPRTAAFDFEERAIELNRPFAEWSLQAPEATGNRFDIIAHATFRHENGEEVRSMMFYAGDNTWNFRFTGMKPGVWTIETEGPGELGGKRGRVVVEDSGVRLPGFLYGDGRGWRWLGNGVETVPQLVMIDRPNAYWSHGNGAVDREKIESMADRFLDETWFTGFHISGVAGMWFNIDRYDTVGDGRQPLGDVNPDTRTFEVLEALLLTAYERGALVHIWLWGSDSYKIGWGSYSGPNGIGGAMSETDQRLNRYIAARLGPIPGWSMGYGYDLHVWTNAEELQEWYDFTKEALGGWPHMIGARGDVYDAGNPRMLQSRELGLPREPLSSIFWSGDYVGHYDYRVPYSWYVAVIEHSNKPQFQEDRFRIREHNVFENKDYTPEMTIRGLWHSTMAGGVANIWGNLIPATTVQASRPYDNRVNGVIQDVPFTVDIQESIATYGRFWFEESRFSYQLVRDNTLTGNQTGDPFLSPEGAAPINVCLRNHEHTFFVFYIEEDDFIRMDLSEMGVPRAAYAVDTRSEYYEHALGLLEPELLVSLELPYPSDWAIVVGDRIAADD